MTNEHDSQGNHDGAEAPRRGPRLVEIALMLIVPALAFLIDLEAIHRAGAPSGPIRRLRRRLGRLLRPE